MSLIIHKKAYQDFLSLLNSLQTCCQNSSQTATKAELAAIRQELERVFQTQILTLSDAELNGEVARRWVSLQTEIQREFRLLNTDCLFWVAARQQTLAQARQKVVTKRLNKLIDYCQLMLTL